MEEIRSDLMRSTTRRARERAPGIRQVARLIIASTLSFAACSGNASPAEVARSTVPAPAPTTSPAEVPRSTVAAPAPTTSSGESGAQTTQRELTNTTVPSRTTEMTSSATEPERALEISEQGGVIGPLAYWMSYGNGFMCCEEALIAGTLLLIGDCMYVELDENVGTQVALWPYGTSFDANTRAVTRLDGTAVTVGEHVVFGGGYHTPDRLGRFTTAPEVYSYLDSCDRATTTEVAVIQSW